ncbi:hypothetical protein EAO68_23675 [Streptomyces sp. wa22]|nr:hypothetical protein EAO68_23675 [Streptomyces sp. wa22]
MAHRRPDCLADVRDRLAHGDPAGARKAARAARGCRVPRAEGRRGGTRSAGCRGEAVAPDAERLSGGARCAVSGRRRSGGGCGEGRRGTAPVRSRAPWARDRRDRP